MRPDDPDAPPPDDRAQPSDATPGPADEEALLDALAERETAYGLLQRGTSLLAYLLFHRDTPQPRQHLAFLLWPDSSESQARTNLRYTDRNDCHHCTNRCL